MVEPSRRGRRAAGTGTAAKGKGSEGTHLLFCMGKLRHAQGLRPPKALLSFLQLLCVSPGVTQDARWGDTAEPGKSGGAHGCKSPSGCVGMVECLGKPHFLEGL